MADKTTIARPYAKAAFEEARGENRLGPWSDAIRTGAVVVTDPRVEALLGNPRVTSDQLAKLVIDIAGPQLGEHGANFVSTLAENHRLGCREWAAVTGRTTAPSRSRLGNFLLGLVTFGTESAK